MAAYRLCMQSRKATQASRQVATRLPGRTKWILRQVQLADGAAQCAVRHGQWQCDNRQREARQTGAGAIWETRPWRNVRTAQDSVAANGCPPGGEDQSNRDESRGSAARQTTGGVKRNLYAQQNQVV